MRILLTGAGGLVGRALTTRLLGAHEVVPLTHQELDVRRAEDVRAAIKRTRPDLVINCAVTGVDECELDAELATAINVDAPRNLARSAQAEGGAFLHFSSNYVFGGDRSDGHFYTQDDEPHPVNRYGMTKLEGERAVLDACERSWIVRTSWVFGRGKESFLATLPHALQSARSVVAVTNVFASATWVEDLVERMERIITRTDYGLYQVTNSGVCSYAEFADAAADVLGLPASDRRSLIRRTSSSAVPRPARRPRWTPMRCTLSERAGLPPMRPWQEALEDYIACDVLP